MVEEEEAPIHTDPRGFLSYKKKTQTIMLNHLRNFSLNIRHPTLACTWQTLRKLDRIPIEKLDMPGG